MIEKKLNIYEKMQLISQGCQKIPKNGYNSHSKYKYVRAVDVLGHISKLLHKYGVLLTINEVGHERKVDTSIKSRYSTTLRCEATFTNIEKPDEKINANYFSTSADTLDKDAFKAKTNGLKYLLSQQFMIITDDFVDTEADTPGDDGSPTKGELVTEIMAKCKVVAGSMDDEHKKQFMKEHLGVDAFGELYKKDAGQLLDIVEHLNQLES